MSTTGSVKRNLIHGLVRAFLAVGGLVILGAAAGIAAKEADESGIGWLGDAGTYPALWILALALIGRQAPSPPQAALRAAIFFVTMCLAYYAWTAHLFAVPFANVGTTRYLQLWIGLSVTVVPATASMVWWASRQRGVWPGAVLAVTAGLVFTDGVLQRYWLVLAELVPQGFPQRPVQADIDLTVAGIIVVLLPRWRVTRWYGLLLLVPAAWVVSHLVDIVFSALV